MSALDEVARVGRELGAKVEAKEQLAAEARRERQRDQRRERYQTDPEFRESEKARARGAHRKLDTADRLIRSAYQRAKKQGVPFSLTKADIAAMWPNDGRCPVLGFRMLWDVELDRAPSLDRFDRELGYTTANVRIISFRANRIRGDASTHELLRVLAYAANPRPQLHTNADLRATYRGASPWGAGQPGDVTELTVKSGGKK